MRERPALEALYRKYKDKGLEVVGIAMDKQGKAIVAPYLKRNPATFSNLLDPDSRVARMFSVRGMPTNFLFNRKGEVIGRSVGYRNWSSQDAHVLIESLL